MGQIDYKTFFDCIVSSLYCKIFILAFYSKMYKSTLISCALKMLTLPEFTYRYGWCQEDPMHGGKILNDC